MNLIKIILFIASILLIITPVYFIFGMFYHIDPINRCVIRVDNKSDLTRQTLKYMKRNSTENYTLVCKNLNKIVETVCFGADWNIESGSGSDKPGCYLRGTKIAYLKPTESLEQNSEHLVRFAEYSKEYWNPTKNTLLQIYRIFKSINGKP